MVEYGVRDKWASYDDELPTFETYEDAEAFIETHPSTEDGLKNEFEILKRTVSDWERA